MPQGVSLDPVEPLSFNLILILVLPVLAPVGGVKFDVVSGLAKELPEA